MSLRWFVDVCFAQARQQRLEKGLGLIGAPSMESFISFAAVAKSLEF